MKPTCLHLTIKNTKMQSQQGHYSALMENLGLFMCRLQCFDFFEGKMTFFNIITSAINLLSCTHIVAPPYNANEGLLAF